MNETERGFAEANQAKESLCLSPNISYPCEAQIRC